MAVDVLHAIVLGIIQGLTEFLPVSSSGHLVLAQYLFSSEFSQALAFDVVLHLGTLTAVLIYFRADLFAMAKAFVGIEVEGGEALRRWVWLLALSTVPIVVVAGLFADSIELAFSSVPLVGASLLCTGLLIFFVAGRGRCGSGPEQLSWQQALLIGGFQVFGIVPGISRSGSTIAGALLGGVERETAAKFAFLMSVPAIVGAMVHNADSVQRLLAAELVPVAAGAAASAVTGWLAIEIMMQAVRRGRLLWFAIYCLGLGSLTLIGVAVGG